MARARTILICPTARQSAQDKQQEINEDGTTFAADYLLLCFLQFVCQVLVAATGCAGLQWAVLCWAVHRA